MRSIVVLLLAALMIFPVFAFAEADDEGAEPEEIAGEELSAEEAEAVEEEEAIEEAIEEEEETYTIDLEAGVEARVRFESRNNPAYATINRNQAEDLMHSRIRGNLTAVFTDTFWGYIEGQNSRTWDDETSGTWTNEDDMLRQLFINFSIYNDLFEFRVGRQEMNLGDERLVGENDWDNIGNFFDGLTAIYRLNDKVTFTGFGFVIDTDAGETKPHSMINEANDVCFWGLYMKASKVKGQHDMDLYIMNRYTGKFSPNRYIDDSDFLHQIWSKEKRWVIGTRWDGTLQASPLLHYNFEFAYQFGLYEDVTDNLFDPDGQYVGHSKYKDRNIMAWMVHLGADIKLPVAWPVGMGAEYTMASGQRSFEPPAIETARDTTSLPLDIETFDPLFNSTGMGEMDLLGLRNAEVYTFFIETDLYKGSANKPTGRISYHVLRLAETVSDSWYLGNGEKSPLQGMRDAELGEEIDVTINYPVNNWLNLVGNYSRFFRDKSLAEFDVEDLLKDMNLFFLGATVSFNTGG